jgi:hypothetical protein
MAPSSWRCTAVRWKWRTAAETPLGLTASTDERIESGNTCPCPSCPGPEGRWDRQVLFGSGQMPPVSPRIAGGGLLARKWSASVLTLALAGTVALGFVALFAQPGLLAGLPGDTLPLPPTAARKAAAPSLVTAVPAPGHVARRHRPKPASAPVPAPSQGEQVGAVPSGPSGAGVGEKVSPPPAPAPSAHQPGSKGGDETTASPPATPAPPAAAPAPSSNPSPAANPPSSAPEAVVSTTGPGHGNGKGQGAGRSSARVHPSPPPAASSSGSADPGKASEPSAPPAEAGNASGHGHAHGQSSE